MDLRDILEGESTMLADGLTMDFLIIFYHKNTNSSFQRFSPPGTLPIFSTSGPGHWPPKLSAQSSFPKQRLQLPKCPALASAQPGAPCHPNEHVEIHPQYKQQETRHCRHSLDCLEETKAQRGSDLLQITQLAYGEF